MALNADVVDACESIDAAVFTGTLLLNEESIAGLEEYIGRWQRAIEQRRSSNQAECRNNEVSEQIAGVGNLFLEAAKVPGTQQATKIDVLDMLHDVLRGYSAMLAPFEYAPEHIQAQFADRIKTQNAGFHAHQLDVFVTHLEMLQEAFKQGDAQQIRQFLDLYRFQ